MTWLQWLRACSRDPNSPARIAPGSLGMLTGQDARCLAAIDACWQMYAAGDTDGERAALAAVRALLPGMQSKCHRFARELIAKSMDWHDRDRVWALVCASQSEAA